MGGHGGPASDSDSNGTLRLLALRFRHELACVQWRPVGPAQGNVPLHSLVALSVTNWPASDGGQQAPALPFTNRLCPMGPVEWPCASFHELARVCYYCHTRACFSPGLSTTCALTNTSHGHVYPVASCHSRLLHAASGPHANGAPSPGAVTFPGRGTPDPHPRFWPARGGLQAGRALDPRACGPRHTLSL